MSETANLIAALGAHLRTPTPQPPVGALPPGLIPPVNLYGYKLDVTPLVLRAIAGEEITLNAVIAFVVPHLPAILAAAKAREVAKPATPVVDPDPGPDDDDGWVDPAPAPPPVLEPDRVALRVVYAKRHGTGDWPDGAYSDQHKREVFSKAGYEAGNNFGRGDKACFDVSPFAGPQKLERDDVEAAGLGFTVVWEIETPDGKAIVRAVDGRMVIEGDANVRIAGKRWQKTLGFNLVIRPMQDNGETVAVRAFLGDLVAEIKFHVS